MGLIYMHGQGIVHGDLKGVCVRTLSSPSCTRLNRPKGKHPDQPQRSCLLSRLQSPHDNLGPVDNFILMHRGRHNSMDESRAPRPGHVWYEDESPNKGIRLLCARNGDLRSPQRADTVRLVQGSRRYPEGHGWRTPRETSRKRRRPFHRWYMECGATLLAASAARPDKCQSSIPGSRRDIVAAT
jgi:hypothetical protein